MADYLLQYSVMQCDRNVALIQGQGLIIIIIVIPHQQIVLRTLQSAIPPWRLSTMRQYVTRCRFGNSWIILSATPLNSLSWAHSPKNHYYYTVCKKIQHSPIHPLFLICLSESAENHHISATVYLSRCQAKTEDAGSLDTELNIVFPAQPHTIPSLQRDKFAYHTYVHLVNRMDTWPAAEALTRPSRVCVKFMQIEFNLGHCRLRRP